ncbi:hypothetical protein Clacol_006239 [Clathrus columnatus]|uniref:DNA replication regulator SLD2 n=1 Tax=Clathrus columnatus TaxID=1419009 RepID=A0AAV5ABI5_9AGAM|nr:hypothetical protein Clacol_006239 [Clathrus columnatus]
MNEDLNTVKTEIKHWEHSFKDTHGHEPTRGDIKANPVIAEKYKVYNKLKKKTQEQSHVKKLPNHSPPPSHPRPCPAPAAIIAARASPIVSSTVSNTKNPFSPVKQKKHFDEPIRTAWNPFMTPVKSASVRTPPPSSSHNPDLGAYVPDLIQQTAKHPNTIILKARKRLRGDSVSPSPPQRDKRNRINDTIANAVPVHRSNSIQDEWDNSFIEESPAKPTTNGKAFQPLFNDISISSQPSTSTDKLEHCGRAFMKAKTLPSGLFGMVKDVDNHSTEDDFDFATEIFEPSSKRKGKTIAKIPDEQSNKKKRALPGPKGLIPDSNNLFEHPSSSADQVSLLRKRTISRAGQENANKPRESNAWSLLPPSPPAQESKPWNNVSSKTKKRKLLENALLNDGKAEESDAETDDIDIVGWHEASAHRHNDGEVGLEVDPELRIQLRLKSLSDQVGPKSRELETFEIDLPEEMHKMLALSPRNVVNEKEEEDLVRSVMKGRRRGGVEVWGPGEFEGESESSGKEEGPNENDWEGEGIPWEVGEL